MVRNRRTQVPHRWEDYTPMGGKIGSTPFVPCKTPLDLRLCRKLRVPDNRFTVEGMLVAVSQKGLRVGTVIDLCDTDRYLDQSAFVQRGIRHVKIYTPGNRIPYESSVYAFFDAVDAFRKEQHDQWKVDNAVICVISTHGVNRVGYFVCRYLIEKLAWGAKSALRFFEDARGYSIERRALKALVLATKTPSVSNWKTIVYRYEDLNDMAKKILESDYYSYVPPSDDADFVDAESTETTLSKSIGEGDVYPDLGDATFIKVTAEMVAKRTKPEEPAVAGCAELASAGNFTGTYFDVTAVDEYYSHLGLEPSDHLSVDEAANWQASTLMEDGKLMEQSQFQEIHKLRKRYFQLQ